MHDDLAALDFACGPETDADDSVAIDLVTIANPPGTVAFSTSVDGCSQRIELGEKATRMTESELAEEIVLIADLANQEARSAQFSDMLASMRDEGHDSVTTRDFLSRELSLPSPEEARAARARIFAARYSDDV